MAIDSKTPRFLRNYFAGIAAPWFVSINRSVNAATGIMGAILQQCKDNLNQTQIAVTNAATQAQVAGQSAQAASTSATQSAQSASNAQGFAAQVQAAAASYGKLWLGDLTTDPTTDNNGNALIDSARYYNTTTKHVRIYSNGAWNDIDATTEAAQQDALVSASQASQSAALANSLYSQTAQNASQVQNLLSQAQSILYWMNTYWLGSASADLSKDRNGNPITNGAEYYNTNLNSMRVYLSNQWKTLATTDITDDIKNRYVEGTWGNGSDNLQVKGLNWMVSQSSPLITYLDKNGNDQSVVLATMQELTNEMNRAVASENEKISGTLGMVSRNDSTTDYRGFALHWNGANGTNLPAFGYGSDINNVTYTNLTTQKYVDDIHTSINQALTQTQNDYVKRDGSLDMYGPLNIDLGSYDLSKVGTEFGVRLSGQQSINDWYASPSFESHLTGPINGASGLRTSYWLDTGQSYLDLYHSSDKGSASLFLFSDGHMSSGNDIWAGLNANCDFKGKAIFAAQADIAENYLSHEELFPGLVVKISDKLESEIETATTGDRVFGIISTSPGLLINDKKKGDNYYPVALKGRVPAKVTGTVKKGDALVLSSIRGTLESTERRTIAQKIKDFFSKREVVAFALEDSNSKNTIEVALK